ncbi:MAG: winged helix-turn-helix domain-containing protein [Candidatus Nanoarchaeia archaeon]|nr:winged helix-turn-helix domain-containing protein [Candidatus Nanoarchaeia archaeon]
MDIKKLSFVVRSKTRRKILMALESNKMPSQLKKELKLEDSNVARGLRELESAGLIRCIIGSAKMGRIFRLTKEGKEIRKELIAMSLQHS